jgi:hypothetical protein
MTKKVKKILLFSFTLLSFLWFCSKEDKYIPTQSYFKNK